MILLICGSRQFDDPFCYKILAQTIYKLDIVPTKIISGGARGVDSLAKAYAISRKIPFEEFPAQWHIHGRGAGFIRNKQMVEIADIVVALWDGHSRGTKHTIEIATKKGIPVITEIIHVAQNNILD